eukprot:TRINITY_DN2903_c0_g1_i1.p1 TRINITY_DN2903_c0_g1~~TRINITY_DN2903_c0_g1_i1.p1  ORF type:complete len:430 (-),score=51.06 TRINITY_DN2903_c0_g1_i1:1002-2180(-)
MTPSTNEHRGRLSHLVNLGMGVEKERGLVYIPPPSATKTEKESFVVKDVRGVDFDSDAPGIKHTPNYETRFITTHKESCRVAKFSPDGKFVATGSTDTSIKLLDVDKMLTYSQMKNEQDEMQVSRPVVRTFYDHTKGVNDVDFHPYYQVLASCSKDCTIKLYDYSTNIKRSFKQLQDTHNIKTINFHPCGDYLVAGTTQTMIRIYDVKAEKSYVTPNTEKNHQGPINMVRYSSDGRMYVSGSRDGTIKLWDGINGTCTSTITHAHGGHDVYTVLFSKNKKYILSAGRDATAKIWDVGTGKEIHRIVSGSKHQQWKLRLQLSFSFNEDFIFTADENNFGIMVWDTRTGELVQKLQGHNSAVRCVTSSPIDPYIMSCSDDHRARFWVEEGRSTE